MSVTLYVRARKLNFTKITRSKRVLFGSPSPQRHTKATRAERNSAFRAMYPRKHTKHSPSFSPPRRKAWGLMNVTLYVRTRKSNFTKITGEKEALFGHAPSPKVDKSHARGRICIFDHRHHPPPFSSTSKK